MHLWWAAPIKGLVCVPHVELLDRIQVVPNLNGRYPFHGQPVAKGVDKGVGIVVILPCIDPNTVILEVEHKVELHCKGKAGIKRAHKMLML